MYSIFSTSQYIGWKIVM